VVGPSRHPYPSLEADEPPSSPSKASLTPPLMVLPRSRDILSRFPRCLRFRFNLSRRPTSGLLPVDLLPRRKTWTPSRSSYPAHGARSSTTFPKAAPASASAAPSTLTSPWTSTKSSAASWSEGRQCTATSHPWAPTLGSHACDSEDGSEEEIKGRMGTHSSSSLK
jgi:hypothetical protein